MVQHFQYLCRSQQDRRAGLDNYRGRSRISCHGQSPKSGKPDFDSCQFSLFFKNFIFMSVAEKIISLYTDIKISLLLKEKRKPGGIHKVRSAVDRILAGEFKKDNQFLNFSTPRIELSVQGGEIYEGSFFIYGPDKQITEGRVSSSRLRMQCLTERFAGSEEEIVYQFDASDMEEGESVVGEFCIVSNHGEYSVPYKVTIAAVNIESSLGDIRNLFHFTNLAKTSFEEAVNLFYSEEFERVFQGTDSQYYSVYRGLSSGEKREQNVEEFLIEVKKKQKVEFLLEENEIRIDNPQGNMEYKVVINRNGWGYSDLMVETEGDFLVVEKTVIREEDFLGNCFRLPFYISEKALHGGKNYGTIRLYNAYTDLKVSVQVYTSSVRSRLPGIRMRKKHTIVELMQYYEAYRAKKISTASWMQETDKIIDQLQDIDSRDVSYQLMKAQLLITQERYSEADWMLKQAEVMMEGHFDPALYCYFLYLTTLINRDEAYIDETAGQVERIFAQNSDNWRIAWLLLYLSEDYSKSPSRRWMFLEEQYRLGSKSPVVYIEAYNLMTANPALLMKLEGFELKVLIYAAKKGILNADIAELTAYLSLKIKVFSKGVYYLLKKCYEITESDEVLRAICTLLIKGNMVQKEHFTWYALGIERELRITRLYEYYMMSCELSDKTQLPKMVLMYFAFDSSLDSVHNAFLYAYMHKNKENYPELYESYREQIERFVVFQILKGRNNKWLSYLYNNVITPVMITEETAKALSKVIFIQKLSIRRSDIRKVIVVYEKQQWERSYPVSSKEIYIPVYGSDNRIFLEDGRGCRYCCEKDYELERLLIPDKLALMAAPFLNDDIDFDLWMCERGRTLAAINDDNMEAMKRVAASGVLAERLQKEIRMRLIHFFYDNDKMREIDLFLADLTPEMIENRDYAEVVRFMIIRGMYEKAYEWIRKRGGHGIEAKSIMRLSSRLIAMEIAQPDDIMTSLVYMAFQAGKYDEYLLRYLTVHYYGTVKSMRDIWKAAVSFGVDTYEMSERILMQILYTGAYIGEKTEIFKSYVNGGAKTEVEMAFLSQCCFDYFVSEQVTDEYIMEDLQRVIERKEDMPMVCKLAYTKYYAENKKQINEHISHYLVQFLRELLAEEMYFPYFKEYADNVAFMRQFADKTMIQYKAAEGNKAMIHYLIEKDEGDYIIEEMPEMFCGICVKQFILFFGEKIQYYITENDAGKEHLTHSGTLNRSDTDREQKESKYSLINDIVIGRTLNDEDTMSSLLHEYYEKEFIVRKLFHII